MSRGANLRARRAERDAAYRAALGLDASAPIPSQIGQQSSAGSARAGSRRGSRRKKTGTPMVAVRQQGYPADLSRGKATTFAFCPVCGAVPTERCAKRQYWQPHRARVRAYRSSLDP